ncbi:hypothetical protein ACIOD0_31910 [Kitasatospora albolonga]
MAGRPVAVLSGGGVESAPDPAVRPRWAVHFAVDVVRDPEGALFTVPSR